MHNHYAVIALLTIGTFLSASNCSAQKSDKIEADRPSRTSSPYVVPKKALQVETGFELEKTNENERGFSHPELLVKYGLCDWLATMNAATGIMCCP